MRSWVEFATTRRSVVLIVVVLEHHLISFAMRLLNDLRRAEDVPVLPLAQMCQSMAAVATNHKWDLSAVRPGSCKALIVVRVAGEKCMGPYTHAFANPVNLREHLNAPAVG